MSKMVKCKSCGATIAKTARVCPQCGAQQHVAALTFCYLIGIFVFIVCLFIIFQGVHGSALGNNSNLSDNSISTAASTESEPTEPVFTGEHAKVSFLKTYKEDLIDGAFYMVFEIENTSSVKELVYLSDVYVDDLACFSGSGLPVTILPGKKANGTFIVFFKGDFDAIRNVEAKIIIADESTMDKIEESEQFKIEIN